MPRAVWCLRLIGLQQRDQLDLQRWQAGLCGSPDRSQVNVCVTVAERIAHAVSLAPRQIWIGSDEGRVVLEDISGGFANDFQVSNDRILCPCIGSEILSIEAGRIGFDTLDSLKHMLKIIMDARWFCVHTACASARIRSRRRPCRAPVVVTWTGIPISRSNSSSISAMSNRVVAPVVSTRRSRSL